MRNLIFESPAYLYNNIKSEKFFLHPRPFYLYHVSGYLFILFFFFTYNIYYMFSNNFITWIFVLFIEVTNKNEIK